MKVQACLLTFVFLGQALSSYMKVQALSSYMKVQALSSYIKVQALSSYMNVQALSSYMKVQALSSYIKVQSNKDQCLCVCCRTAWPELVWMPHCFMRVWWRKLR